MGYPKIGAVTNRLCGFAKEMLKFSGLWGVSKAALCVTRPRLNTISGRLTPPLWHTQSSPCLSPPSFRVNLFTKYISCRPSMYTQAGFIHRLSSQHEHAQTNPTEASPDAGWWRRDPRCHCWRPPPAQQMVRPPPPPSRPPSWNVPNKLCQWTVSDVAWCNRDSRGYKRGWKSDLRESSLIH